jgi:2-(1,2-epoxy-1,2-dihydrophenyl)acetyl-CoA isomerase
MSYPTLHYDVQGGIATITLNRPDNANAVNLQMARDLHDAAARSAGDAAVRAVIVTGAGKLFSGGGDVAEFAAAGAGFERLLHDITANLHVALSRFMHMDKALVCAVNGACAGGALGLALCGDIVLAADGAKFTTAYTAIGMAADGGSTFLLPRLIGLRRTQELFMTNRRLTAQEALAWGLVTEVVPAVELGARARAIAEQLGRGPRLAHGAIKRLLATTYDSGLETQLAAEARAMMHMAATADGREGVAAFVGKRAAGFEGR